MPKRVRSPNYPSISLRVAIDQLGKLGETIHTHSAPRDLVLSGMGFSGAHGTSLGALSALQKYGLLEREGEEFRITELGMQCLHPESDEEKEQALRNAAHSPKLFAELSDRFADDPVSDDLFRNYLVRKGFSASAASSVLLAYRETWTLVDESTSEYDPSGFVDGHQPDQTVSQPAFGAPQQGGRPPMNPAANAPTDQVGKFRVSMTDEFYVDVSASRLDRSGVKRLVSWLNANQDLVPEAVDPLEGEDFKTENNA